MRLVNTKREGVRGKKGALCLLLLPCLLSGDNSRSHLGRARGKVRAVPAVSWHGGDWLGLADGGLQ